jgi:hypothetical protein
MTTPEQARQLVKNLREVAGQNDEYGWHYEDELAAADCIESLLEQLEKADVTAYREAMNADVGTDYKSPGNTR